MENEIVTIYIDKGMYSRVTPEIMDAIEKYMSTITEIYSVNSDYETNFIRLIFYNEVDESLFKIFNGIPGVNRIPVSDKYQLLQNFPIHKVIQTVSTHPTSVRYIL